MAGAQRAAADASAEIAATLAAAGVDVAFGVPGGGANLALIGACARHGIRFVLMHGETSAVIAAGAHAELTGRPGLVVVTRGPGLAAAANGIAHALLDRLPVIVATDGAGHRHPHQRLDHGALAAVVAKGVADDARVALALATAPPWGPVVLDVGGPPRAAAVPAPPVATPLPALPPARRPLVVVGVGARGAEDAVRGLVRGTRIPVLETYKATGTVPRSWPNAAGPFTATANEAPLLAAADLVVLAGVDPVELVPGPWPGNAPVVSLAPWPVDDPAVPTLASAIGPLAPLLDALVLDASGWEDDGATWRAAAIARLEPPPAAGLGPLAAVRAICAALPVDATVTVDAGAHMLAALPLVPAERPGAVLISSGLATMGCALPAAIGASLAGDGPVVCITGDGGLGMCLAELETVARLGRDVRVVVLDDRTLSLIAIKQGPGQGGPEAVTYAPVDFAGAARAAGLEAVAVDDAGALRAAVALPGPRLVAARIDPAGYGHVLEATRGARR